MRQRVILAVSVVTIALLAGCAQQPITEPTADASTNTPAASAPSQAPERPANRYGLDCPELADPSTLESIFGTAQPFGISNEFGGLAAESLVHDGALLCRWGDGPYLDSQGTGLQVVAAPSANDVSVALQAAQELGQLEESATVTLGQLSANGRCVADSLGDGGLCNYVVVSGQTMIAFQLSGLPLDQISTADDSTESPELVGSLNPNSTAFTLMDGIVRKIATAAILPEITANPLPDCDSVVSWATIAEKLELPLGSVLNSDGPVDYSANSRYWSYYDVALNAAGSQSAERQGVRRCSVEIGMYVYDEQTAPISLWAEFVPEGAWVRDSGLWLGWDQEVCQNWAGGPACEYSWMSPSGVAAHVRVQGGLIDDEGPAGVVKLIEEELS